jgi:hypothetical protein
MHNSDANCWTLPGILNSFRQDAADLRSKGEHKAANVVDQVVQQLEAEMKEIEKQPFIPSEVSAAQLRVWAAEHRRKRKA